MFAELTISLLVFAALSIDSFVRCSQKLILTRIVVSCSALMTLKLRHGFRRTFQVV